MPCTNHKCYLVLFVWSALRCTTDCPTLVYMRFAGSERFIIRSSDGHRTWHDITVPIYLTNCYLIWCTGDLSTEHLLNGMFSIKWDEIFESVLYSSSEILLSIQKLNLRLRRSTFPQTSDALSKCYRVHIRSLQIKLHDISRWLLLSCKCRCLLSYVFTVYGNI